jgi:hypothetical protein
MFAELGRRRAVPWVRVTFFLTQALQLSTYVIATNNLGKHGSHRWQRVLIQACDNMHGT